ncbi:MAG: class I SAM-dependent methyltransferase [Phenylobacterium sp.]
MKIPIVPALIVLCVASGAAMAAAPAFIAQALSDPARPKDDVAADAIRDPADTLVFAGVKPGMTVAELFPGGGYFTRMLSDIVGPKGRVFAIENAGWKGAAKADQAMIESLPQKNVELQVQPFGQMAIPQPVDLFWITQNYHDLKIAKYGAVDMGAFNAGVFKALKPGGVYLVIDHQANPGTTLAQIADLHRVEKAQVIAEVSAAGFKLAGEGKFLNRPGDDHTKPIFDKSIQGKTDQYALKFVKPKG